MVTSAGRAANPDYGSPAKCAVGGMRAVLIRHRQNLILGWGG